MARRCLCSRLLQLLRDDPRLVTLPLGARMLFLLLAEASARAEAPGVLPFADPRRVALLVSATEVETGTHLETLEAERLIRREGATLVVPAVAEVASRAEVARRNGAAGGRPRKGETREAYLARRQGALPLPIAGGVAPKPEETQAAKPPAVPSTTTYHPSSVGQVVSPPPARDATPEWVSLGQDVLDAAGIDPARWMGGFLEVKGWLDAGHAPEAILAAVQRVAARPSYRAERVRSLRFFADAVAERSAPRQHPVPLATTPDEAAMLAELERRMDRIQAGRLAPAA
jgi:hypothetical protein